MTPGEGHGPALRVRGRATSCTCPVHPGRTVPPVRRRWGGRANRRRQSPGGQDHAPGDVQIRIQELCCRTASIPRTCNAADGRPAARPGTRTPRRSGEGTGGQALCLLARGRSCCCGVDRRHDAQEADIWWGAQPAGQTTTFRVAGALTLPAVVVAGTSATSPLDATTPAGPPRCLALPGGDFNVSPDDPPFAARPGPAPPGGRRNCRQSDHSRPRRAALVVDTSQGRPGAGGRAIKGTACSFSGGALPAGPGRGPAPPGGRARDPRPAQRGRRTAPTVG